MFRVWLRVDIRLETSKIWASFVNHTGEIENKFLQKMQVEICSFSSDFIRKKFGEQM
jgi:hypothetical protein